MRTPVDRSLFRRRIFSGNPPHAPYRCGWIIRLGGPAPPAAKSWLKAHGYTFGGGKWARCDRERSPGRPLPSIPAPRESHSRPG